MIALALPVALVSFAWLAFLIEANLDYSRPYEGVTARFG
jgi:hypothetical protein